MLLGPISRARYRGIRASPPRAPGTGDLLEQPPSAWRRPGLRRTTTAKARCRARETLNRVSRLSSSMTAVTASRRRDRRSPTSCRARGTAAPERREAPAPAARRKAAAPFADRTALAALTRYRAQQHAQQDRAEHGKLHDHVFGQPQRMDVGILPADIGFGVPDGGEAVLGVPNDVRRETRQGRSRLPECRVRHVARPVPPC